MSDDRDAVFEVMKYLDREMSAGHFADVDRFIHSLDVETNNNPAYLLAIVNYVCIANERGHHLEHGSDFRKRVRERLVTLVGEQRTASLLKFRGG